MGGSSLAPEVICRTAGVPLVVLDTTDPGQVAAAMADLDRTVVVVSSKSGGTVETDSQRGRSSAPSPTPAGRQGDRPALRRRHRPRLALSETAAAMGARAVFLADPNVGGRYSALSAFGLVPSALAGADVGALLDEAEELAEHARRAGQRRAGARRRPRRRLPRRPRQAGPGRRAAPASTGFGDWAEQLIAESTGKEGRGILPVVLESADAPGATGDDVLLAVVGGRHPRGAEPSVGVTGPLGAQFLGWEYATAVAGRVLGINPFDQPNVTESKENTQRILGEGLPDEPPAATIGAIEVRGSGGVLDGVDLSSHDGVVLAIDALLARSRRAATSR